MILLIMLACTTTEPTQEDIAKKLRYQKCMSKSSGSQPECWDETDWAAFCERVTCKNQ